MANWDGYSEAAVRADRFKFPKNKATFISVLNQVFNEGKQEGSIEQKKRMEAELAFKQKTVRIESLKILTDYYRAVGQTANQLTEAMKSESGQI